MDATDSRHPRYIIPTPGFGTRLREFRRTNDLDRKEIGILAGPAGLPYSMSTVSHWETGHPPGQRSLLAVAQRLEETTGVSASWWITGIGEMVEDEASLGQLRLTA